MKNCSGLTYDIIRETVFKSRGTCINIVISIYTCMCDSLQLVAHVPESRLKVLDIMDEYQSEPRCIPKNNGPAYGKIYTMHYCK